MRGAAAGRLPRLGTPEAPPWTRACRPRRERTFLYPEPRARPCPGYAIAGVRQLALLQRQAPAPDALRQPRTQPLQLRDPLVDAHRPSGRQLCPVGLLRDAIAGQLREL